MNSFITSGFEHIKSDYLKKKAELEKSKKNTISVKSGDGSYDDKEKLRNKLRNRDANYRARKIDSEDEDDDRLSLSQKRLQMKAKIYDKLSSALPSDEINAIYMVDFQRKYIHDKDDTRPESEPPKVYNDDELRIPSEAVHFQEVFGDEARELGVGYFKFSTDEAERQKQMEEFERMEKEREEIRANNPLLQAKIRETYKDKIMAKLRKKERRKITAELMEELIDQELEREKMERENIKKKMEDEMLEYEEYKKKHLRPWDKYKSEHGDDPDKLQIPKPNYIMNQERWVDKQREERNPDFAPPSDFYSSNYSKHRYLSDKQSSSGANNSRKHNLSNSDSDSSCETLNRNNNDNKPKPFKNKFPQVGVGLDKSSKLSNNFSTSNLNSDKAIGREDEFIQSILNPLLAQNTKH
ncbi:unnamed protein product [Gordionus sp. m RMFG-2023]